MNRFNVGLQTRLATMTARAALAGLLAAALSGSLSGCGTGQISQTAAQAPAVNGVSLTFNNVALRDVRIQAVQSGDFLQPGRTVELVLVAVNQSPDITDKLVDVSSDIGTVTLSGDTRLPASGLLLIGSPHSHNIAALSGVESVNNAKATVALTKPISNGLTYNFTFDFEKGGKVSATVPISAGESGDASAAPAPQDHLHPSAEHQ